MQQLNPVGLGKRAEDYSATDRLVRCWAIISHEEPDLEKL